MKSNQQHHSLPAKTHATAMLQQHAHTAGPLGASNNLEFVIRQSLKMRLRTTSNNTMIFAAHRKNQSRRWPLLLCSQ